MALPLVLTRAAQRDAVVKQAIVSHLGRLPDDDAHAVVNDQTAADFGAGMNFNARPATAPLAHHPGQELQVMAVQEMGDAVIDHRVHPWIKQENLQTAPRRRVAGLIGPKGLA